jgi:hypothetical protein
VGRGFARFWRLDAVRRRSGQKSAACGVIQG